MGYQRPCNFQIHSLPYCSLFAVVITICYLFKSWSIMKLTSLQDQDDNEHMAYWLSNTSALLFLLQRSLKGAGSSGTSSQRKPPAPTSLFGRMTMVFNSVVFSLYMTLVVMWFMRSSSYYPWCVIWFALYVTGISVFSLFCESCCTSTWNSPWSWCQIPSSAFQAAAHSLCGENLWNCSRQLEERVGIIAFLVYSGMWNFNLHKLQYLLPLSGIFLCQSLVICNFLMIAVGQNCWNFWSDETLDLFIRILSVYVHL